ncbi:MAG TPA: hypothetical protein VI386_00825 [Candidatus Sulfotelmatobacter sp.]
MGDLVFSEEIIQKIFGHEAAEDEEFDRLKEYYFKSKTYDKIKADLPLRILVGHKGIGKSALFKVAMAEDREDGRLPVFLRPNDIIGIQPSNPAFLNRIAHWKHGLQAIIAQKTLDEFGIKQEGKMAEAINAAGKTIGFLRDTLKPYSDSKVDLTPAQKMLVTKFLKKASITVYIDDLDRGWQGQREDILNLSALVNALRDLSSENPGLKFKLSLRSDVYFLLRTSDESTDKLEGSVVWFAWSNHEILALLAKRIETFFGRVVDEQKLLDLAQPELAKYLMPLMVPTFRGVGKWECVPLYRVLMSLIRKRPRDLVKLCSLAARHAYDNDRSMMMTDDFRAIFEEYSQGRVQDTINEFKSELPDIERLVLNMKPGQVERRTQEGYVYKTDALLQKIKNLTEQGKFTFTTGSVATPKDLARFMYKINFLTARKWLESGELDRKYFEENRYLSGQFVDYGYEWEVHPAYRWALQPDSIGKIYEQVELSEN